MLEIITNVNKAVNGFVWGVPAMILILGVGLMLTIRTRFVQLRKFGYSMRETVGRIFAKDEAKDGVKDRSKHGAITPFQAVCTALSATVGTGNIAGVAGAIAIGGPGAVFWMWISALLGMCTKFVEVTLAVRFRERNKHGDWVGGPMYFIKNGLGKKWMWLAVTFAALGTVTVFGTGNATQVNAIITAINSALSSFGVVPAGGLQAVNIGIGALIAIMTALVLLGGIKRIGRVAEKLVPFMALLYVVLGLGVVVINIRNLPGVFANIVRGAFDPAAVTGGVVGSMFLSMRNGVARGIFSNEAGLGTASIAHASADTDSPVKQGLFGIFEVFCDTIVICTLTALIILCSGIEVNYGVDAGAALTISGFVASYGSWVTIFTAVALCSFALSTILGWGLYGMRCVEFIFGSRANKTFMLIYSMVSIVGATIDLGLLWSICDTFNGLMAIPNLIAVALLSPVAVKLIRDFFAKDPAAALKR